ncbi:hypothetical protein Pint_16247 [Pistacia integerrima]|uniref:Uncharacterized protein n=1 Tax=Pistacia integerrima TaxID=434235 RepID=A0ACC0Z8N8_9ROSI|nr:hypothetical protein Pint_16247 [Pistacia integerrima]
MEKKRKKYYCAVCGKKFQREKREQWRKRLQDLAEFGQSFEEEDEQREELFGRCIKTTTAWDDSVLL